MPVAELAGEVVPATFDAGVAGAVWHVEHGTLDLFVARRPQREGEAQRLRRLGSLEAGTLVAGLPSPAFGVVARASPDAVVRRVARADVEALAVRAPAAVGAALDAWLAVALERPPTVALPPRTFVPLETGIPAEVAPGDVVRPVGAPLWVEGAGLRLHGHVGSRVLGDGELAPTGQEDWLEAERGTTARAHTSEDLAADGRLWAALDTTLAPLARAIAVTVAREEEDELERVGRRAERDVALRRRTGRGLAQLMTSGRSARTPVEASPTAAAATLVAAELGVGLTAPPAAGRGASARADELDELLRASRLFQREVALRGDWYRRDVGPLIAFRGEERRPVALLRRTFGYDLHDPTTDEVLRVDAALAAELATHGRMLYRALPDRPLRGRDLLRFGLRGTRRDLAVFAVAAVAVALGLLAVPLASGEILGTLVPDGERGLITQLCVALLGVAVAVALLATVQNLAALRVEGRVTAQIQEGLWARVMRLSPAFFRRFAVGDLATRALGLTQVQELVGTLAIRMAVAAVAVVVDVALITALDPWLGLLVVGLFAGIALVCVPVVRASLPLQRRAFDHQREVNARAFQLVGHVGKLRSAAAEERAFAWWAEAFSDSREATYAARRIQNRFAAFAAAFSLGSFAVVFLVAGAVLDVPQATFFVFAVAYGQALAATLIVVVTAANSLGVVPLLEGMTPILEAVPEAADARADPGELSGAVRISGVTYGYDPDGPAVLHDVSIDLRPGEFVAVVGPSGSGKSTLLRLMLGFDAPQQGAVLYDDQDLSDLDVTAVRRQCGVVLQDAQLFAGDLLSNVVGSGVHSADDAWAAIEMVGMDAEVAALPMGMYTVLSEGAGTLSGGQRQRIALARALVTRPRILVLDEATSALDNRSQEQVMASMRRLNATRFVIAHRLSTIRDADRIVVLRDGRVVEEGSYEELMAAGGEFRRLAERQLA